MRNFFNINNPVFNFIGKIVDIIVLHFFWVVCCLPVVTFGPATVALYYSMMKTVDDKEGHYYRRFFSSFKQNLKQGIPLGLIFLVLVGGLVYAIYLMTANADLSPAFPVFKVLAIIFLALVLAVFQYIFPLQARFENKLGQTIKNGMLIALQKFHWTLVMLAIFVAYYALYINFIWYIFPLFILGFGLVVFLDSFILNRIFQPYIDEIEDEEEKQREEQKENGQND